MHADRTHAPRPHAGSLRNADTEAAIYSRFALSLTRDELNNCSKATTNSSNRLWADTSSKQTSRKKLMATSNIFTKMTAVQMKDFNFSPWCTREHKGKILGFLIHHWLRVLGFLKSAQHQGLAHTFIVNKACVKELQMSRPGTCFLAAAM